jgi:hypothetical protein
MGFLRWSGVCADANDRPVARQLRTAFSGVRSRQLLGRAAGEKMNKRVTIMNKSNHSTASTNESSARILACRSGRNPCRLEELRARMHAEQGGKTPDLPWGQWRPSSQCAAKIRSVLAVFETIGKLFAFVLALTLTGVLHGAPANAVPGRLLVKPRDGINESDLQRLFAAHGAQQHDAIQQINVRILRVPDAGAPNSRNAGLRLGRTVQRL